MTDRGRELLAQGRARRELREVRTAAAQPSMAEQVRQLREGSRRLLEETRQLREELDEADRRRAEAARAEERALVEADSLPPRSRQLFDDWRREGRSAIEAMDEVRRSGLAEEEQLAEVFQGMRGMTPEAARLAARGRDGWARPADPFDAMVESFVRLRGMTPEGAKLAAIGRDRTEAEARHAMRESAIQREVDEALREAALAVAKAKGWDDARSITFVQDKVAREWADVSVTEGVARLKAYARELAG